MADKRRVAHRVVGDPLFKAAVEADKGNPPDDLAMAEDLADTFKVILQKRRVRTL